MKKLVLTIALFPLLITGCNKNKTQNLLTTNQPTIDDIVSADNQDAPIVVMPIPTEEVTLSMGTIPSQKEMYDAMIKTFTPSSKVDLDLSVMTSSMIYSMVFEMLLMPESYEEKNLKVKGNFVVYISEETGDRHFAIIIPDATQCCQQGLEFVWFGEDKKYPEDFPKIGQEITLTGKYKCMYTDEGFLITFIEATDIKA